MPNSSAKCAMPNGCQMGAKWGRPHLVPFGLVKAADNAGDAVGAVAIPMDISKLIAKAAIRANRVSEAARAKPILAEMANAVAKSAEAENLIEVVDKAADVSKMANKLPDVGNTSKNVLIPQNDSQIKHIFGSRPGHLPDTPDNRKLLSDIANTPDYYRGTDRYGNQWHIQIDDEGRQIWTRSKNGKINNGGRNDIPYPWDKDTGLYRNLTPHKKYKKRK